MKVENARLMEMYEKWLSKEDGFTRATMRRNEYSKMMKAFSEAGLKRTNFRISIKQEIFYKNTEILKNLRVIKNTNTQFSICITKTITICTNKRI